MIKKLISNSRLINFQRIEFDDINKIYIKLYIFLIIVSNIK